MNKKIFKCFKKSFLAYLLSISRPTLDRKIKADDFSEQERKILASLENFYKEVSHESD